MNTHAILKITFLFCVYIMTPIEMDIIDSQETEEGKDRLWLIILIQWTLHHWHRMWHKISISFELLGCTGTLKLNSYSNAEVVISSSSYKDMGRRRQIRRSSRELKSRSRQGFAYVSMEGNCCWRVREKGNGAGSHEYLNPALNFLEPGWTIRSFEVLDSCQSC